MDNGEVIYIGQTGSVGPLGKQFKENVSSDTFSIFYYFGGN